MIVLREIIKKEVEIADTPD